MRLSQQVEIGLEARRVGKPDLAQRAEADTRRNADQPAHRLRSFFAATKPGATQREDAVGKDEVPVAFDCLESAAPISAAVGGQKFPVFPVETGNFFDFPHATVVWLQKR